PADSEPVRRTAYTALVRLSNVLDALTFLSLGRAWALLIEWALALAAWGALRRGTLRQRLGRALFGPLALAALGGAALMLPRPVPRRGAADSSPTGHGYRAHTH